MSAGRATRSNSLRRSADFLGRARVFLGRSRLSPGKSRFCRCTNQSRPLSVVPFTLHESIGLGDESIDTSHASFPSRDVSDRALHESSPGGEDPMGSREDSIAQREESTPVETIRQAPVSAIERLDMAIDGHRLPKILAASGRPIQVLILALDYVFDVFLRHAGEAHPMPPSKSSSASSSPRAECDHANVGRRRRTDCWSRRGGMNSRRMRMPARSRCCRRDGEVGSSRRRVG